jgi:hypothetical protein
MSFKNRVLLASTKHFDQSVKSRAFEIYKGMLRTFMEDLPLEMSEAVDGFLNRRDYLGLIEWADSVGSAEQATAAETYAASQLAALITKYPFPDRKLKPKAKARALEKFANAEMRCRRYNVKFNRLHSRPEDPLFILLNRMKGWIGKILGDEPDLQSIYADCGFGPGASIGVTGETTNLSRKLLADKWTCTPSALPYALASMKSDYHLWEFLNVKRGTRSGKQYAPMDPTVMLQKFTDRIRLVHYNNIVTVPKTTKVDRTIAVEPLLNGFLQKGVDENIRKRLLRVGLDLRDQQRNQDLARLGSMPDQADPFVTIDLSSASDSVSLGLTRWLLPPSWFHLMDAIRSPAYRLPGGRESRYEKIASMGNGFCFPLETLIFASVCALYAKPGDFTVYGDDIIVRQSVSQQVVKTLWRIGFRHNTGKTFLKGPFRESCGADWYEGQDVRPLALDDSLDSLSKLITFHNMSLRKPDWALRFAKVREYLRRLVPERARFMRPFTGSVGGAFEVELDMFMASRYSEWNCDISTWSWRELCPKAVPDTGWLRYGDGSYIKTLQAMAAVRGLPSHAPFSYRRKTTLSVRRMSYAGASSNWLPPGAV